MHIPKNISFESKTRIMRDQAERVTALWQKPILSIREIAECLDIPFSTYAANRKAGDTPPLFNIGRRLFCRTCDLLAYLDAKSKIARKL